MGACARQAGGTLWVDLTLAVQAKPAIERPSPSRLESRWRTSTTTRPSCSRVDAPPRGRPPPAPPLHLAVWPCQPEFATGWRGGLQRCEADLLSSWCTRAPVRCTVHWRCSAATPVAGWRRPRWAGPAAVHLARDSVRCCRFGPQSRRLLSADKIDASATAGNLWRESEGKDRTASSRDRAVRTKTLTVVCHLLEASAGYRPAASIPNAVERPDTGSAPCPTVELCLVARFCCETALGPTPVG